MRHKLFLCQVDCAYERKLDERCEFAKGEGRGSDLTIDTQFKAEKLKPRRTWQATEKLKPDFSNQRKVQR
jgi:hypothetical protein